MKAADREVILETRAGVLWLRERRFLHFKMAAGHDMTIEDYGRFDEAASKLFERGPLPLLVDRSNPYSSQFPVWRAFGERAADRYSAIAYYAPTKTGRMASELIRDHGVRRSAPMEIFQNLPEAERWLRSFAEDRVLPPD